MKDYLLSEEPVHRISPTDAVIRALRKTFHYSGRASRSEYWWFVAAYGAVTLPFVGRDVFHDAQRNSLRQHPAEDKRRAGKNLVQDSEKELSELLGAHGEAEQPSAQKTTTQQGSPELKPSPLTWAIAGLCTLPLISLKVRRLHDSNLSGWWLPLVDIAPISVYAYTRGSRDEGVRFDDALA